MLLIFYKEINSSNDITHKAIFDIVYKYLTFFRFKLSFLKVASIHVDKNINYKKERADYC